MADTAPSESQVSKVAESVLKRNLQVQPGERVTIEAWPHTLPWAVALAREARRLKALPMVLYEDESGYWDAIESGEAKILGTPAGHEWAALSKTDVYIHMWGPGDRLRMNALPASQQTAIFRFNDHWYEAARKAGLRGARLELGRPYPTLANVYGVDQATWSNQVAAATLVDPNRLARSAVPIVKALQSGRRLRISHSNGTDLTLGLAKRPARSYVGRPVVGDSKRRFDMLANLPSGAIRVALDESVAEGTIVGNRTCYYDDGKATGPTFHFSGGRLVEHEFDGGSERFEGPYRKGGQGRDRPGFFSIGLNPELHDTPQLEDIEMGAIMVSVGGNRNLGGKNKSPFFGWAITAGATVEVDGRTLPIGR